MKRARTSSVLMERICAMVKAMKLMAILLGVKAMSPVMARALELEARHGPLSCAMAETENMSAMGRTARRTARDFIDSRMTFAVHIRKCIRDETLDCSDHICAE